MLLFKPHQKLKLVLLSFFLFSFLLSPFLSLAQDYGLSETASQAGLPQTTLTQTIGSIIQTILTFVGAILFILFIYGGFLWMTSAGEEEKTKKAKQIITSAVIGLLIIASAYALTYFVMRQVIPGGTSTTPTDDTSGTQGTE